MKTDKLSSSDISLSNVYKNLPQKCVQPPTRGKLGQGAFASLITLHFIKRNIMCT